MSASLRRCITCLKFKEPMAFLEGREKCNRCRRLGKSRPQPEKTERWVYPLPKPVRDHLTAKQDSKCAICNQGGKLVMDHDHATGYMRGMLCPPCNYALGWFRDDPERLRRAIEYLTSEPTGAVGNPWGSALRRDQLDQLAHQAEAE